MADLDLYTELLEEDSTVCRENAAEQSNFLEQVHKLQTNCAALEAEVEIQQARLTRLESERFHLLSINEVILDNFTRLGLACRREISKLKSRIRWLSARANVRESRFISCDQSTPCKSLDPRTTLPYDNIVHYLHSFDSSCNVPNASLNTSSQSSGIASKVQPTEKPTNQLPVSQIDRHDESKHIPSNPSSRSQSSASESCTSSSSSSSSNSPSPAPQPSGLRNQVPGRTELNQCGPAKHNRISSTQQKSPHVESKRPRGHGFPGRPSPPSHSSRRPVRSDSRDVELRKGRSRDRGHTGYPQRSSPGRQQLPRDWPSAQEVRGSPRSANRRRRESRSPAPRPRERSRHRPVTTSRISPKGAHRADATLEPHSFTPLSSISSTTSKLLHPAGVSNHSGLTRSVEVQLLKLVEGCVRQIRDHHSVRRSLQPPIGGNTTVLGSHDAHHNLPVQTPVSVQESTNAASTDRDCTVYTKRLRSRLEATEKPAEQTGAREDISANQSKLSPSSRSPTLDDALAPSIPVSTSVCGVSPISEPSPKNVELESDQIYSSQPGVLQEVNNNSGTQSMFRKVSVESTHENFSDAHESSPSRGSVDEQASSSGSSELDDHGDNIEEGEVGDDVDEEDEQESTGVHKNDPRLVSKRQRVPSNEDNVRCKRGRSSADTSSSSRRVYSGSRERTAYHRRSPSESRRLARLPSRSPHRASSYKTQAHRSQTDSIERMPIRHQSFIRRSKSRSPMTASRMVRNSDIRSRREQQQQPPPRFARRQPVSPPRQPFRPHFNREQPQRRMRQLSPYRRRFVHADANRRNFRRRNNM